MQTTIYYDVSGEVGGAAMRVEILHEDVVSRGGARGRVFVLCR